MSAMRESAIRPTPKRRRPIWGILVLVALGMVALFVIGFGISLLFRGESEPVADSSASAMASAASEPCVTTMVIPAQILPVTSTVSINVYNSTNRVGLAGDTADVMRARGFIVKKVANDPKTPKVAGVGEIRYGPKAEAAAQLLTYYLPGAELVPLGRTGKNVDFVVGKQFDAVTGDGEVAAAMASPSPSSAGPGCATPAPGSPGGAAGSDGAAGGVSDLATLVPSSPAVLSPSPAAS